MLLYFTDPILRAPTMGCMLICFVAAVVGALSVLKRQSLVGEALSHAAYPGVMAALLVERLFFGIDLASLVFVLVGASISCLIGMWCIDTLEKRARVSADAAMCLILALFFGIGITLVSVAQVRFPTLYKQMQSYLFGQAATMTDVHVVVYAVFAVVVLTFLVLLFRPIHLVIFDPQFARSIGINTKLIDALIMSILVVAVVIGIRSVGVVLMSAMLIFPCVTARAWTNRLSALLIIAGFLGTLAGFFGVFFSHEISLYVSTGQSRAISFPTGPMIVVIATLFFAISFLFAPNRGLIFRAYRRLGFFFQCQQENILKNAWKHCVQEGRSEIEKEMLYSYYQRSYVIFWYMLYLLQRKGWLKKSHEQYELTPSGMLWGRKIVRLHRLWEVYLVEYCGLAKERVHPSAEKMEHIITPEIEKELTELLHDPVHDPHAKPIPPSDQELLHL